MGMVIVALWLLAWVGCTCNPGNSASGPAPEVADALEQIEGTRLDAPVDVLPPLVLDGGAVPDVDVGEGVQVLQIAPVGLGHRALQAAAVFDRPMVALTDLDSMSQSAPLNCSPDVAGRRRWAGTSTAVLVPEGGFPRATAFRCAVAAGTTALDGTPLEKELAWTFETARPRVVDVSPHDGADRVDLTSPVVITFDQPIRLDSVRQHLTVTPRGGAPLRVQLTRSTPPQGADSDVDVERLVELRFQREPDTTYQIELSPGVLGTEGPLPSTEAMTLSFATFPPLSVELRQPESSNNASPTASIVLGFSTPVTETLVSERISIDPQPKGWDPPTGDWQLTYWTYRVVLAPQTTYTIKLEPGISDVFGQTLDEPQSWTFTTGDYNPWLSVPRGFKIYAANNPLDLPYKHLNAEQVDLRMASMAPEQLGPPNKWYESVDAVLAATGEAREGAAAEAPNRIRLATTPMQDLLNDDGRGWIATRFSASNVLDWEKQPRSYRGLMVVTDLGGTMKVSPGATDVWVTSLSEGTPVRNVEVEVYQGPQRIGMSRTNDQGLARVAGAPTAQWERWDETIWALLRHGSDVSVVHQGWNDGLSPYNFNIWGSFEPSGRRASSHGFIDRGVYRPGDDVHARVTFRFKNATGLDVPSGTVTWSLTDPHGESVSSGTGSLDDRGGISVTTTVPADGDLGDYLLRVDGQGEDWSDSEYLAVLARAYRAPAFRVRVKGPERAVVGEDIEAVVDARYLFGAPLNGASVKWSTWTESRPFSPKGWDGWSFEPLAFFEGDEDFLSHDLLGNGVSEVERGRSTFVQSVSAQEARGPVGLFFEAAVEDVDRQVIVGRQEVMVHPGEVYLGGRAKSRLAEVGQAAEVEVAAVGLDGEAASGISMQVQVLRRTWDSVRERGMDGQWRWVTTASDTEVTSQSVTSGSEPQTIRFTPTDPGFHLVVVRGNDAAGRDIEGVETLYVVGDGYVGWGRTDRLELELVPDKQRYAPGETAKILVKSPYENLRALVTAEREGVLFSEVVTLKGTADTVQVPIEASYRPNIYVSVVAVTGAGPQDAPDKGRPEVLMGMTDLVVDAEEERLAVEVHPENELYRPADKVTVNVSVKRAGAGVAGAGVTLFAVDEAVLSLTDYQTPDPHPAMYAHRPLSVLTADGRTAALDRAPFLTKGSAIGGDGGFADDTGAQTRSKFLTTIAWLPDLRTNDAGEVQATFDLPDNLTTFRIMAVADAGASSFGSGDEEIRVSRPLMVRPALPRHLRAGDEAFAGVVVHNDFAQARTVEVRAEVTGPLELIGAPLTVRVPAEASVEVPFTLRALEEGEARFTFRVASGPDRDAVNWALPIGRDLLLESVATAGMVADGQTAEEQIARPDNALQAHGGFGLDLSTTTLLGVDVGWGYLADYPHACLEQRTSLGLASLAALPIRERAALTVSDDDLRGEVRSVLKGLSAFRTPQGGLSIWAGSDTPSPIATAYAVELIGRSRQMGFDVDASLEAGAVNYLRQHVARTVSVDDRVYELAEQAAVAAGLAYAKQGDAGLNQRLYRQRRDLSVFALSELLQAIVLTTGPDARTAELERLIVGRAVIEPTSAAIVENDSGQWARMWGSDDLSTASALEGLLRSKPDHPLAPKLALHLASRRGDVYWTNTRATAEVLSALALYAQMRETGAGDAVAADVTLAGQSLVQEPIARPGTAFVDVPMVDVINGPLQVRSQGGPLYYFARLAYAPKDRVPRDEGFTVSRSFEIVDGGGENGEVVAGSLLRVTLSVVTPVTRRNVAVVDRIPAGLEPVDSSFATTGQAPDPADDGSGLPPFGGSWVFEHHALDDDQVRLYAEWMPPGVHTYRYVARATTPGRFDHPAATAEEMYRPEVFGRTAAGTFVVGAPPPGEGE